MKTKSMWCSLLLLMLALAITSAASAQDVSSPVLASPQIDTHSATISWNAATAVAGYNVYRRTATTAYGAKLNAAMVAGTSYIDLAVTAGSAYFWVVRSVDAGGVESPNSNEVSGTIPGLPAPTPVTITTTSLPGGTVGVNYGAQLQASGGTAPYTWSGTAGSGLTLAASGAVSGVPTVAGTVNVNATATDSLAASASKSFSIVVASVPPPSQGQYMGGSSTSSLTFNGNGTQSVSVWDNSPNAEPVNIASSQPWLLVSPSSGTTTSTFAVTVSTNVGGLAPGTYQGAVTVTSSGWSNTLTIPVTQNIAAPVVTISAVSPASVSLLANATQQFTGGVASTGGVTWSVNGGIITQTGLYTAPATAGSFVVRATSMADPTKLSSANVTVTVPVTPGFGVPTLTLRNTNTQARSDVAINNIPKGAPITVTWCAPNVACVTKTITKP